MIAEEPTKQHSKQLHFPDGLPAFENVKDFVLIAQEDEAPFMWLQALNVENLAFIVADPFVLHPDYQPDILEEDCRALGIEEPDDAYVLSIVNIRGQGENGITANLVGPIVINWKKQVAKQVIIENHLNYSVKYLLQAEEA
jgi:flagellar assembly factor FliW